MAWVEYSGTPHNEHPSMADTHDIMDISESPNCPSIHFNASNPWIADTHLCQSFCSPNCMQTALDLDLVDTHQFFQ